MATDDNTVTLAERVVSACHSTNLRDEADRPSQTDVLKAMAWSQSRLGSALMRLQSEFDSRGKLRKNEYVSMFRLALSLCTDKNVIPKNDIEKEAKKQAMIKANALAVVENSKWMNSKKAEFLAQLVSLPSVVDQVFVQCDRWGMPEPRRVATVTVGFWLNQLCPTCHGHKFQLMPDSPTLSAKQCKACRGTGLSEIPYGQAGKKVLNHLDSCVSRAQSSIKARLSKLHGG